MIRDPEEIGQKIQLATSGQSGVKYSNYVLEGPKNVPLRPEAYAVAFARRPDEPRYYVVANTEEAAARRDEFRARILDYEVSREVEANQKAIIRRHFGGMAKESRWRVATTAVTDENMPLYFVLFGRTADGGEKTAHIYHLPILLSNECLSELKALIAANR